MRGKLSVGLIMAALCLACLGAWPLTIKLPVDYVERLKTSADCPCPTNPAGVISLTLEGHIDFRTPVDNTSELFKTAFDAWNSTQTDKWTLKHGANLDGTLYVTDITTYANCRTMLGGMSLTAEFVPARTDKFTADGTVKWYWAQGQFLNFSGKETAPYEPATGRHIEMKVSDSGNGEPPLFPNQFWNGYRGFNDGHFADFSLGPALCPTPVFFEAVAMICVADYKNRELVTYQGFSYGWTLTTDCINCEPPEPPAPIAEPVTCLLLAMGMGGALARGGRRAAT